MLQVIKQVRGTTGVAGKLSCQAHVGKKDHGLCVKSIKALEAHRQLGKMEFKRILGFKKGAVHPSIRTGDELRQ